MSSGYLTIKEKETEIGNTLASVARITNFDKAEKNEVNQDLKDLCSELNQANSLLPFRHRF